MANSMYEELAELQKQISALQEKIGSIMTKLRMPQIHDKEKETKGSKSTCNDVTCFTNTININGLNYKVKNSGWRSSRPRTCKTRLDGKREVSSTITKKYVTSPQKKRNPVPLKVFQSQSLPGENGSLAPKGSHACHNCCKWYHRSCQEVWPNWQEHQRSTCRHRQARALSPPGDTTWNISWPEETEEL